MGLASRKGLGVRVGVQKFLSTLEGYGEVRGESTGRLSVHDAEVQRLTKLPLLVVYVGFGDAQHPCSSSAM